MKLLCDAVIVIESHNLKIWQYLQNRHEIFISSVVKDECLHCFTQGKRQFIDMEKDIKRGSIKILTLENSRRIRLPYKCTEKALREFEREALQNFGTTREC
ncbi:MAG TPA: hypothetical protein ENI34_07710 [candidate division WOR-3 bacterium]|uniref:Uncharacterized protein n=1 Tax=candidate division WOR-3 bacterium TaxID=2052148 RepID=A0A9C9EMQ0_UNCW3|nr:hypothetical protein [candidate division WOR-3 bacterium]